MSSIMTIHGPIAAEDAGLTLPHEHVLVDFIGAAETGRHRYDVEEVVARVSPLLEEVVAVGVRTLIECTPAYLARDPRVLLRLAEETGIQMVTNTGQYKEPFLPESTLEAVPESLAESWIAEWRHGIEETGVRPGFIKTAVNPEPLAPVQRNVISAAAITSRETGLPIATHTGKAAQAAEILDILESYRVSADRWIFVHAQNEDDLDLLVQIADRGAWIELDGLRAQTADRHLRALVRLIEAGHTDRLLLSHDSGWYRVGEPGGGQIAGYTFLFDGFVPMMRRVGIDDRLIRRICSVNPGRAFSLRS